MGTQHPDFFAALAAEFEPHQIRTRSGGNGRQLHYITAATVANRLDDVAGPEGWEFSLKPWGESALIGTLTITLPDGTKVSKSNVGGRADMQAADDDAKSCASDTLKRCASLLGVGRYLSRDGVPAFARERTRAEDPTAGAPGPPRGREPGSDDDLGSAPARRERRRDEAPRREARPDGEGGPESAPRSGKALFAWCKEREQKHEVGLIKYLGSFAKLQDWPARMVDFSPEQVELAYQEACRKLRAVGAGSRGAYEDALSN